MRDGVAKLLHALVVAAVLAVVAATLDTRDTVSKLPTRPDVIELVENYAPYARDRSLLLEKLGRAESSELKLGKIIQNNTLAIQDLRIQLEKLAVVRPSDVLESLESFKRVVQKAIEDRG